MSRHALSILTASALLGLTAGCATDPVGPQDPDTDLLETFEALAAEANQAGNSAAAAAFSGGALALQMGVRPGILMVSIDGQDVRHHALVAAVAQQIGGETVLVRSLFAWAGERGPRSMLEVTLTHEEGTFGGTPPAQGSYSQADGRITWVATSGTAFNAVSETGESCGRALGQNPGITCVKARFNVGVDGTFHRLSPTSRTATTTRITITVPASSVPGVIVTP